MVLIKFGFLFPQVTSIRSGRSNLDFRLLRSKEYSFYGSQPFGTLISLTLHSTLGNPKPIVFAETTKDPSLSDRLPHDFNSNFFANRPLADLCGSALKSRRKRRIADWFLEQETLGENLSGFRSVCYPQPTNGNLKKSFVQHHFCGTKSEIAAQAGHWSV